MYLTLLGVLAATAAGMLLLRRFIQGPTFKSSKRLDGKTAIVTGANTGIGLLTAQAREKRAQIS